MNEKWYLQQAVPQGSALYYGLWKMPVLQREAVSAIFAFYQEIRAVQWMCSDAELARAKWNWWRLEVSRLAQGQPSHPLVLALQKSQQYFSIMPQALVDMIDGVEEEAGVTHYPSFVDITIHVMRTSGVREQMIASLLPSTSMIAADKIQACALFLARVETIQYLHQQVREQAVRLSDEEMALFQVNLSVLSVFKTTPAIQALLADQAVKAEQIYQTVYASMTPAERFNQVNLLIRCELAWALLREIRRSGFRVLEQEIRLTPLRSAWIAFTVYRRLRKLAR